MSNVGEIGLGTYQVNGVPVVAEDSGADCSEGSTQAVAGEDQVVVRVGGDSRLDLGGDSAGNCLPGFPEATVDLAASTDAACVCKTEVDVGDPIREIGAATEGDNNGLICRVDSDEARRVAELGSSEVVCQWTRPS